MAAHPEGIGWPSSCLRCWRFPRITLLASHSIPLALASKSVIAENIARIRERIAAAVRCAGRNANEIELMAVTKTVSAERIREAYVAGLRMFGENRVQEFEGKSSGLRELSGARFHMIGHLQRNKAARAVSLFQSIESLDSWRLAAALNEHAGERGGAIPVLLEINVGGEEQKSGLPPDSAELDRLLTGELPHLEIQGLMTVPPFADDAEVFVRPGFSDLLQQVFETCAHMRSSRSRVGQIRLPQLGS